MTEDGIVDLHSFTAYINDAISDLEHCFLASASEIHACDVGRAFCAVLSFHMDTHSQQIELSYYPPSTGVPAGSWDLRAEFDFSCSDPLQEALQAALVCTAFMRSSFGVMLSATRRSEATPVAEQEPIRRRKIRRNPG